MALVVLALICAIGVASMIHAGKWKRPAGILLVGTLASGALAAALLADHLGQGWSFELLWQNIAAVASALGAWLTYPARITAIKTAATGALIVTSLWFIIKLKLSGRAAFGEFGRAIKPVMSYIVKSLRKVMSWRLPWLITTCIFTLLVAATQLNEAPWMYGSSVAALSGFGAFFWLNKKSEAAISAESD